MKAAPASRALYKARHGLIKPGKQLALALAASGRFGPLLGIGFFAVGGGLAKTGMFGFKHVGFAAAHRHIAFGLERRHQVLFAVANQV